MSSFLTNVATDAVKALVDALLVGKSFTEAETAARKALVAGSAAVVDSRWAKLAEPLSQVAREELENPQGRSVTLLNASDAYEAQELGLKWSLKGGVSLAVEIDVLDPELDVARRREIGVTNQNEVRSVVAYAVDGSLSASASGTSVSVWNVGVNAGAALNARLEWFVAASSSTRLGKALIDALPLMPPPMNLRAMLEAAQNADFWGCHARIEGSLKAGFNASASWTDTGASFSIGGQDAAIGLSLGVKGQASFALGGLFELRCSPIRSVDGVYRLRVQLEQLNTREKSLGLELAAGADFSALTKAAETYLRARTPEPNELLLRALTEPGSIITEKIEAALAKLLVDPTLKNLIPLLAGSGGKKEAAEALVRSLSSPLIDKLNLITGEVDRGETQLDDLTEEFASRIFGGSTISEKAKQAIKNFVGGAAKQVTDKLNEAINALAKELKDKSVVEAENIIAPLAALGEKIREAIGDFSKTITQDKAVTFIGEGLQRYAKLRKQVLSVLSDAQRAKLILSVGISLQDAQSQRVVFDGEFGLSADITPAGRLFSALWRGDLSEFTVLREAAEASGSLRNVSGWLERTARRVSSESVTISALGSEFSNTSTKTSDIELRSDLAGNLIALNAKTGADEVTKNLWVQREAKLSIAVRLLEASTPNARSSIEFSGIFSSAGKNLDERLFNDLQRSLAPLTGRSAPVDLSRLFGSPTTKFDRNFWHDAAFVLPMSLTDGEMSLFVKTPVNAARLAFLSRALEAMNISLTDTNIFPFEPKPSVLFKNLTQEVMGGARDVDQLAYVEKFAEISDWDALALRAEDLGFGMIQVSGAASKRNSITARQLAEFYRLAKAVHSFGDLVESCSGLDAELARGSNSSSEIVFQRSRQLLRRASDSLSVFAISSRTFIGNDEPVAWPLVAFSSALSDLARGRDGARFTPMITLGSRPNQPVPLIA